MTANATIVYAYRRVIYIVASIIKSKMRDAMLRCRLTSPRAILSRARSRARNMYPAPIIKISLYVGDCTIMQIIARVRFRLSAPVVVAAGLQADHCIIMQIASLVNTKNVRTTPPADNQPIVLSLQPTRPPWPHLSRFSSRRGIAYTCAIDATRILRDLVAPDASSSSKRGCLCCAVYGKCVTWRGCFSMPSPKLTQHFVSTLPRYCREENKMLRQLRIFLYTAYTL